MQQWPGYSIWFWTTAPMGLVKVYLTMIRSPMNNLTPTMRYCWHKQRTKRGSSLCHGPHPQTVHSISKGSLRMQNAHLQITFACYMHFCRRHRIVACYCQWESIAIFCFSQQYVCCRSLEFWCQFWESRSPYLYNCKERLSTFTMRVRVFETVLLHCRQCEPMKILRKFSEILIFESMIQPTQMPRINARQRHREDHLAGSAVKYYWLALHFPYLDVCLEQGWRTRGSRATFGPRSCFVRPVYLVISNKVPRDS